MPGPALLVGTTAASQGEGRLDLEGCGLGTSPCSWVAGDVQPGGGGPWPLPPAGGQRGGLASREEAALGNGLLAGSLALKCWENLERGKMSLGGRGQSNVWRSWDAEHGI